ncbi:MAG: DNA repair protein RadA, partial [Actinomycetota bacterium]
VGDPSFRGKNHESPGDFGPWMSAPPDSVGGLMAKAAISCLSCGQRALQWHGRCPGCGAWDSLAPDKPPAGRGPPLIPLGEVDPTARARLASGIGEFDRVLGGGVVAGSVVLLAGEPGVGKSTLALQAAVGLERQGRRVVLICGEESIEQVAERARRIGGPGRILASSATELEDVAAHAVRGEAAIVDSIQTVRDPAMPGEAGSVAQVRACAGALAQRARASGTAVVLVGHVTKDGSVAGPRALEHLVDAVLSFEGDGSHALRCLRATKNRFGSTSELGIFEMGPNGLVGVDDASRLFLADRKSGVAGSAVACVMEGRRPLAVEIQALVARSVGPVPRRVANGIDLPRLGVVAATLERRAGLVLHGCDIYASVAGGFRAREPGIDLALALALASALRDRPVPEDLAAIGEVGLAGEVRAVPGMARRIAEAARLGFRRAMLPRSCERPDDLEALTVFDLGEALTVLA